MSRRRDDPVVFTDGQARVRGGKLQSPRKPIEVRPSPFSIPEPAVPLWPPRYPGFYVHVHADGGVHYWRPRTDPDLNDVVSDDGG